MKRIIVLALALFILTSICANTVSALDIPVEIDVINYVSIGDSMSNGLGLEGYDNTDNPDSYNDGRNGFLEIAPDAYPAIFAAWLQDNKGPSVKVNHTQLATSAARAEDIYYMLTRGTDDEFEPDYFTKSEFLENSDRWGDPNNEDDKPHNDMVASVFQDSVKNADIISLSIGDANFGVFLFGRIMNLMGFASDSEISKDNEIYGYMTIENALLLCAENESLANLIIDIYTKTVTHYQQIGFSESTTGRIGDYYAYTVASYIITYEKILDKIIELNPDVEILCLPTILDPKDYDYQYIKNGETVSVNWEEYINPINEYVSDLIESKQATDAYKEAVLIRVPVNENIQFFHSAFQKLYTPIVPGEEYPATRLFCHSRFIDNIVDNFFPIFFGITDAEFDEYDVMEYEMHKAEGPEAFLTYLIYLPDFQKAAYITYYLGFIDAILSNVDKSFTVNLDEINIDNGSDNFNAISVLSYAASEISDSVNKNMEDKLANNNLVNDLYLHYFVFYVKPSIEQNVGKELTTEEALYIFETLPQYDSLYSQISIYILQVCRMYIGTDSIKEELCNNNATYLYLQIYERTKLAWGLAAHPSADGHQTIAQALIEAYDSKPEKCVHSFTHYAYNNDATCEENGTETAKCDYCDILDTREATDTATGHHFKGGNCTNCGMEDPKHGNNKPGDKPGNDHNQSNDNNNVNQDNQNFFARIWAWIVNFFRQLFGLGKK